MFNTNYKKNKAFTFYEMLLVIILAIVFLETVLKLQDLQALFINYIKLRNIGICMLESIENKLLHQLRKRKSIDENVIKVIISEFSKNDLCDVKVNFIGNNTKKINVIVTPKITLNSNLSTYIKRQFKREINLL